MGLDDFWAPFFSPRTTCSAARFFELADQPVGVTVVADDALIDRLFARLRESGECLFYTRVPIEYGELGDA